MWVMLNDAMFSIVQKDEDDDTVLAVRARRKGDLEKVFQITDDEVIVDGGTDYKFRAFIDRARVQEVMSDEVGRIDYDNFKDSVESKDLKYAYSKVWGIFFDLQERLYPLANNGWNEYIAKRYGYKHL